MLLTALALSAAVQPDRWVHVGGRANLYEEYLDKESVKRSGVKVSLWTRRDFVREKVTVWHELEFDCSKRRETILAYIRDDAGTVSHNVKRPHRESAPIPSKSVEERIFKIACR